jgi:hypothetical protein
MTLGELIAALEKATKAELRDHVSTTASDRPVYFDWCDFVPGSLDSYRGYYDHLAISIEKDCNTTVGTLLAACREALGKTYQGYKGGQYTMDADTPVWVANWGDCRGWGIAKVEDDGSYRVDLKTQHFD